MIIKGKLEGKPIFAPDGGYAYFMCKVGHFHGGKIPFLIFTLTPCLFELSYSGRWLKSPSTKQCPVYYRGNCKPSVASDGFLSLRCDVVVNVALKFVKMSDCHTQICNKNGTLRLASVNILRVKQLSILKLSF